MTDFEAQDVWDRIIIVIVFSNTLDIGKHLVREGWNLGNTVFCRLVAEGLSGSGMLSF